MCGRTELPTKLGKENKHLKQHLTNGDDMMPLHLSAQTSGSAMGRRVYRWRARPEVGGRWMRRGLRRLGTYRARSEASASAHRLTNFK